MANLPSLSFIIGYASANPIGQAQVVVSGLHNKAQSASDTRKLIRKAWSATTEVRRNKPMSAEEAPPSPAVMIVGPGDELVIHGLAKSKKVHRIQAHQEHMGLLPQRKKLVADSPMQMDPEGFAVTLLSDSAQGSNVHNSSSNSSNETTEYRECNEAEKHYQAFLGSGVLLVFCGCIAMIPTGPDTPDANVPDVNVPDVNVPDFDPSMPSMPDVPDWDPSMPNMPDFDPSMPSMPNMPAIDPSMPNINPSMPNLDGSAQEESGSTFWTGVCCLLIGLPIMGVGFATGDFSDDQLPCK